VKAKATKRRRSSIPTVRDRPARPIPHLLKSPLLLVVTGPTASGKTDWCFDLARHFGTEVVSADSRQFFREMNAGTAKPTAAQRAAIPHHFIDSLSIHDPYNAGMFERDCLALLDERFTRHPLIVLCGGSGLYIRAVMHGMDRLPPADRGLREELNSLPLGDLQDRLRMLDPAYHARVDLNNPHRLVRAIEVCLLTGRPFSEIRTGKAVSRPFSSLAVAIDWERAALYERIEQRIERMMDRGLVGEARQLYPYRHLDALRTIGYTELFPVVEGTRTLDEALWMIRKNTRNYAKRQMTWLRNQQEFIWLKPQEYNRLVNLVEAKLEQ